MSLSTPNQGSLVDNVSSLMIHNQNRFAFFSKGYFQFLLKISKIDVWPQCLAPNYLFIIKFPGDLLQLSHDLCQQESSNNQAISLYYGCVWSSSSHIWYYINCKRTNLYIHVKHTFLWFSFILILLWGDRMYYLREDRSFSLLYYGFNKLVRFDVFIHGFDKLVRFNAFLWCQ